MPMKKALVSLIVSICAFGAEPCRIEIAEKGSGWPVPMVELRTTHQLRFISDNNGVIAMDAPELMDRQIWVEVASPGYEGSKDGFGMRGVRLMPEGGKTLKIQR